MINSHVHILEMLRSSVHPHFLLTGGVLQLAALLLPEVAAHHRLAITGHGSDVNALSALLSSPLRSSNKKATLLIDYCADSNHSCDSATWILRTIEANKLVNMLS